MQTPFFAVLLVQREQMWVYKHFHGWTAYLSPSLFYTTLLGHAEVDLLVGQPQEAALLRSRGEIMRHNAMVQMLTERSVLADIQLDRSDRPLERIGILLLQPMCAMRQCSPKCRSSLCFEIIDVFLLFFGISTHFTRFKLQAGASFGAPPPSPPPPTPPPQPHYH